MSTPEIARDLTIALINNKGTLPGHATDAQHTAKWISKAYQIIYKAVSNPTVDLG